MSNKTPKKSGGYKNLNRNGRKKGSRNKSTMAYRETLAKFNFDPAEMAVHLFHDKNTTPEIKLKLLQLMTEYSANKPKPMEETPPAAEAETLKPEIEPSEEELKTLINLASAPH